MQLTNESSLSTNTLATGNAGNITAVAREAIALSNFSYIDSNVESEAIGDGGNIILETPVLEIIDVGGIPAVTFGDGNAGSIFIQSNEIEVSGHDGPFVSLIAADTFGGGEGGTIEIDTRRLRITDGANIRVLSGGSGNGGSLVVRATESVEIDAGTSNSLTGLSSAATFLGEVGNSEIIAGNGADITVVTESLRVNQAGRIAAKTRTAGNAGNITIQATEIEINGNNQLEPSTIVASVDENASGDGGRIVIDAERLRISDGGEINVSTQGTGDGGNIFLEVDELDVSGISDDGEFVSRIIASSETDSTAGSINITTDNLTVSDRAQISVSNTGTGDAGNLTVNADNIFLDTQGSLQGEVIAGEKGNINLTSQFLLLRNGSNITTNASEAANGGNININSAIIAGFENSDIVANAVEGNGGNIDITTQGIFGLEFSDQETSESDITASSQFGVNGTVEINNITIDPNSGLFELPTELTDPSKQIANGCSSNNESSFVATGRGGMPQNPTESVDINPSWSDIRDLSAFRQQRNNRTVENAEISNSRAIVEATGFIRNEDGVIELVALENIPLRNKQVVECSGTNT